MLLSSFGQLIFLSNQNIDVSASIWTVDDDGFADYTNIQEAINNASSGDTIYIWEGMYNERIIVNKTVTIIGNGTDKTIINSTSVGTTILITEPWVNISGLSINSSGTSYNDACIRIKSNYCKLEKINCSNSPNGIYLDQADHNIIKNCYLTNNNIGINLYISEHNEFSDNIVFNNNNYGFYFYYLCNNNMIKNNSCSENQYNFYISQNCQYNIFEYNTYELNGVKTSYNNIDYWILQNSNSNTFSNNTGGGISIQSSTNNNFYYNTMLAGGIQISANQYTHWVHNFDDNNTIIGKKLIYWVGKNGSVLPNNVGQVILVDCINITIRDTNIKDLTWGITLAYSDKSMIENNRLMNNSYSIYLTYSNENIIRHNICNLNENDGIYISRSNSNVIFNNTCNFNDNNGITNYNSESNSIEGSTCNSNNNDGIYESGSIETIIVKNTCTNNNGNGLRTSGSNEGIFSNNIFSFNNLNGIYLSGTAFHATITGGLHLINDNNCNYNNGTGLYNYNSNKNEIINNSCSNNKDSGIIIRGNVDAVTWVGKDNTLEKNVCNYNTNYGIHLYQATENQIVDSKFNSNKLIGVYLVTKCMLNDFCNNEIISNGNGISLQSSGSSKFMNNTIINNEKNGIISVSSNTNTFINNNCSNNKNGIIIESDSNTNTIFGNDFIQNSEMGISVGDNCTYNRIFHNNIISLFVTMPVIC